MKKTLFPIVLVSALMTIISCNKSFDAQEEGLVASSETKTFTATIESDDTKTTLTSERKVNWVSGDRIVIIDNSGSGQGGVYTATPKTPATQATFTFADEGTAASTPKFVAYYPASICWSGTEKTAPTLPATQTCDGTFALSPMYASSESTSLPFKNICSVIKLITDIADVSSIELSTTDTNLSGEFTMGNDYAMTMTVVEATAEADKKVTLDVKEDHANDGYYYIAIPAQVYTYLTIKVTDNNGVSKSMLKKMPSSSLARNTIYTLTFVPNEFSVSSTKKVFFSPGNLWSDGASTPTLYFEDNQWSSTPSSNGPWKFNHVSHFYWTNDVSKADDSSFDNYTGDDFFAEEGNNLTVNGESDWYALSNEEWEYLLGFSSSKRNVTNYFAKANVNGVKGLLIFPDGYTGTTSGDGIAKLNNKIVQFPTSSILTDTWSSMEAAGCVFLPAAGYRDGSGVAGAGIYGYYWSSPASGSDYAYNLYFAGGTAYVDYSYRSYGFSVRLVRE